MCSEAVVRTEIEKALAPVHLEVSDLSDGCGAKFHVLVVSDAFEGKPLLQRHRLVNDSLSAVMQKIHAVTIKTYTPAQWADLKEKHSWRRASPPKEQSDEFGDDSGPLDNLSPELRSEFTSACNHVQSTLSNTLGADVLLNLYGCYKVVMDGPSDSAAGPTLWDMRGKAKFNAWVRATEICGGDVVRAAEQYVAVVREHDPEWTPDSTITAGFSDGFGVKPSAMQCMGDGDSSAADDPTVIRAVKDEMPLEEFRRLLRTEGVDVADTDSHGVSAVHWACDRGLTEHLRELLTGFPTLVHATDDESQTPLHYAALCGHAAAVRILLQSGADVDARDSDGNAPADMADDSDVKRCLQAG